jgi:hypothetical protein
MSNVMATSFVVRAPWRTSLLAGGGVGVGFAVGRGVGRGVGRDVGRAVGRGVGRAVGRGVTRDVGRAVDWADNVAVGSAVGIRTAEGLGVGMGEPREGGSDPEAGEAGPQLATTSETARVSHARGRFASERRSVTFHQSLRHMQHRPRDIRRKRSLVTKTNASWPDRIRA